MMYNNIHKVEAPMTQDDIPPEMEVLKARMIVTEGGNAKGTNERKCQRHKMRGTPGLVEFCSELTK